MFVVLVEADLFFGDVVYFAVYPDAHEAFTPDPVEDLLVSSLALSDDWSHDRYPCAFAVIHDRIYDLIDGLARYLASADRAVRDADARVKQPQIVIYLRYSSDRRTRILARRLLVDRYRRRQALYVFNVRFFHLPEEHPGVRRKALHVPSLSLCIYRIKSERRLSAARKTGQYDHLVPRDRHAQIFKIVFCRPSDDYVLYHVSFLFSFSFRKRTGGYPSAGRLSMKGWPCIRRPCHAAEQRARTAGPPQPDASPFPEKRYNPEVPSSSSPTEPVLPYPYLLPPS